MRIGFIGLGRMGANMARRLVRDGHEVVAFNRTPEKTREIMAEGVEGAFSVAELDLAQIAGIWRYGSVVRSWLLDLLVDTLGKDQEFAGIKGWVADSGEGRWTVQGAMDRDVPAPVITLSLLARFRSRQDESYGAKMLAALRNEFGGHAVRTE